ncbi:two-component system sensor histidine kinase NtrB [Desulfohalovibrio reitneri]|uniref:two-component system sensor histidine kinase NtrB n=1 Tax=Desulfohalovibrio reitneri TaxID=1307759 RepID=UPI0004A7439C|nr:ATP-binding protein [Desulfohalovibrio reitneri]
MLPLINSSYFQNLVEGFTNGVLIINALGEVYVANTAASHILGCSVGDCTGKSWADLLDGVAYKNEFDVFMQEASAADRCNLPFFTPFTRKDGQDLYLSLTTSPLVEAGKLFGIMILITDVTSIYRMHERETSILTENNKLQRERYESLHNISQAIAHQIRNPMMTIGGFANLLLKGLSNGGCKKEHIKSILEASMRLEDIVSAVSDYTSLSLKERRRTSIRELVENTANEFSHHSKTGDSPFTWRCSLEQSSMMVDPELLAKALVELFDNAVDADGDHAITITGHSDGANYRITVQDQGAGIAPDNLPYVRDPFFTTKAVGVGMGLCNVERIVKEHKGDLHIDSEPGTGTAVSIYLPLDFQA